MKKFLKISLIIIVVLILLYFVAGFLYIGITENNRIKNLDLDGDTITITENEYINYIDELYINTEKYVGKKIIIEGFYGNQEIEGIMYNFVGRKIKSDETDNHEHDENCEHSHYVGLEFVYDNELPERGTFIQVTGKLALVTDEQDAEVEYLTLTNCEIKTDIPVGQEYVK